MFLAINVDKQPMLPMVEGALNNLFHNPADAFFSGRIMDLLYDGVEVDCSADDNTVKAICMNFDAEKAFRKIDDTHYAFSLFAGVSVREIFVRLVHFFRSRIRRSSVFPQMNATDLGEMKVLRGKKNHKDVGRVLAYNGEPGDF